MAVLELPAQLLRTETELATLDNAQVSLNRLELELAVLARDYNCMIALGGNIYFLAKIFSSDSLSFQHAAATMTGMSQEAYAQMMLDGGRSPEGNRTKDEWKRRG